MATIITIAIFLLLVGLLEYFVQAHNHTIKK